MAQPQITYPQNPVSSVTVLTNVFGSVLVWLAVKYGLGSILSPDILGQVAAAAALAVMGAVNIVIRKYLTAGALSFSAPLSQVPSQDLPVGTTAVTVPHASVGGAVATVALPPGQQTINVPAHPAPVIPPPPVAVTVVTPPLPSLGPQV